MSEESVHLLGQGAGYGVLVGVGAAFAIGMIITTKLLQRYLHEDANSTETFSVANRSVGLFLSASAVYSSWTWATESLWVGLMTYNYGIQASYYYGAGLCIQIAVMSLIGIHAKKKIPTAHTSLEAVNIRYGKSAPILYLILSLFCNIFSASGMILGAAGAISIIAGNLHIVAATMLIPFGVLLYTVIGGLKATFLTDFIHTTVLLIIFCYLNTSVLSSEQIGGLNGLYNKLLEASKYRYIEGNYEGSVLTGKSQGAVIFGLILTCGNFGLTVMDSSFWQKTFSASPRATVPAYLLTAVFIVSNVFPIGAICGGALIFLESDPSFPTYPRKMTAFEVGSGFVIPYVLKATLGNGAVGAILLVIYLAVTSTLSAQMVSVSSIVSFDIYKRYINPQARNKSMITVSHIACVVFGFGIAGFSVMLHYVNVNMTLYGYAGPIFITPGVIPLLFTITWSRQTFWAAFISPIVGLGAGIAVWLTTASHYYGAINIESLGGQLPALFGGLTALLLPGVTSIIISLIKPEKFEWAQLKEVDLTVNVDNIYEVQNESQETKSVEFNPTTEDKKDEVDVITDLEQSSASLESSKISNENQITEKELDFWIKFATGAVIFILLITWVIWPMSLYRNWIFTAAYFKGYVTFSMIWLYITLILIGFVPFYTGRHSVATIFRGLYNDYIKK